MLSWLWTISLESSGWETQATQQGEGQAEGSASSGAKGRGFRGKFSGDRSEHSGQEATADQQLCTPRTYACLPYVCLVHWGLDASGSSLESNSNCFWNLPQMFSFLGRMFPHFLESYLSFVKPPVTSPPPSRVSLPLQSSLFPAGECTEQRLGGRGTRALALTGAPPTVPLRQFWNFWVRLHANQGYCHLH